MRYVDILRKLIALGDKLPEVLEIIQRIYPDILRLIEIGKESLQGSTLYADAPSPDELAEITALEAVLESNATAPGTFAAGGERIKALIQFIAENPQVIAVILSLL